MLAFVVIVRGPKELRKKALPRRSFRFSLSLSPPVPAKSPAPFDCVQSKFRFWQPRPELGTGLLCFVGREMDETQGKSGAQATS